MSAMDELGEMFGVTFNESKIAAVLREHEERLKELESRFTFQLAVDAEDRAMKAESRVLELEAQVKSLQVERSESDYESGVADGFRAGQASSPFPVQVKSLKQANHRLEARVNAANGESLEYKVGYESALRKIAELLSLLRLLGECQEHGNGCLPFYRERIEWLLDVKESKDYTFGHAMRTYRQMSKELDDMRERALRAEFRAGDLDKVVTDVRDTLKVEEQCMDTLALLFDANFGGLSLERCREKITQLNQDAAILDFMESRPGEYFQSTFVPTLREAVLLRMAKEKDGEG